MANQLANQQTIDLKGELSTNLNKNKIMSFDGFNVRKNPYLNGCLKTFQKETKEGQVIDSNGNVYKWLSNGNFTINGIVKANIPTATKQDVILDSSWTNNIPDIQQYYYVGKDKWLYFIIANNEYKFFFYKDGTSTEIQEISSESSFANSVYIDILQNNVLIAFNSKGYIINSVTGDSVLINSMQRQHEAVYLTAYNSHLAVAWKSTSSLNCRVFNASTLALIGSISDTSLDLTQYEPGAPYIENDIVYFPCNKSDKAYIYLTLNFSPFSYTVNLKEWLQGITADAEIQIETTKYFMYGVRKGKNASNRKMVESFLNNHFFSGGWLHEDEFNINVRRPIMRGSGNFTDYVLFNGNQVSGISYADTEYYAGTLITPWLSVESGVNGELNPYYVSDGCVYFGDDNNVHIIQDEITGKMKIFNDMIIFDSVIRQIPNNKMSYNAYDIKNETFHHFASDWNNRMTLRYDWTDDFEQSLCASGLINYVNQKNNFSTAMWGPAFVYGKPGLFNDQLNAVMGIIGIYGDTIDFYSGNNDATYQYTIDTRSVLTEKIKVQLKGTKYPIATDGNSIFNPSLHADFFDTNFMMNYMYENNNYYSFIYHNGKPIFLYADGSQLGDLDNIFIIQGQIYIIRNNTICSASIENNLLIDVSAVISCGNMRFIGASIAAAYFYSDADRYVYIFTGDRKLNRLVEMSELNEVRYSNYDINTNSFFIVADNGCYIIMNEEYIFQVDGNFEKVTFTKDGFALKIVNEESWKVFRYYGDENIPVEFETAFFGLGDNRLSVIDCWYIRLYCEQPKDGTVECSILTMTDEVKETNKQLFHVTKNDWDALSQTFLIRYQPKYQRSIGTSLKVKSDFDIQDLQCSFVQDTALQISKVTNNKITVGAKI